MCGFIVTNKIIPDLEYVNRFVKFRGPDSTDVHSREGISFVHNLLSMTGKVTTQPFVDGDIVALFNGEIYNYKTFGTYVSDGECIIPLFRQYGPEFVRMLDGEFAICIYDFSKRELFIASDVFRVKPMWIAVNGAEFGVASYESALQRLGFTGIRRSEPNAYAVFDKNFEVRKTGSLFDFDLNQTKKSFDDWTRAFEDSIRKRYIGSSQKVFIGLSSGYDSGAIACELAKQGVDFFAYSTIGRENTKVLEKRHALLGENSRGFIIKGTQADYEVAHHAIEEMVEDFKYEIYSTSSDYNEFGLSVKNDNGANGLSFICSLAKRDGRRIYMSGQGSDEIFSDYGFKGVKKFRHSNFGGLFPDDLRTVFPWASFYGSSQLSYLAKEEHISGAYGLEGRYPYLDKYVVQEFLSLTPKLKNSEYKSVLYNYLKENRYPFEKGKKVGFSLT